ncbi:hypothetical protein SSCG_02779 [Streptomyces clavuligerus]|nr:hypothetical protein SSCG_02779 [Streptomyces clavuligerus]
MPWWTARWALSQVAPSLWPDFGCLILFFLLFRLSFLFYVIFFLSFFFCFFE